MLRRQPIIDAIIGPQAYQVLPKVLSLKSDKNKIFLEFQEEEKFSKLGHNRNRALLSSFITIQKVVINFVVFVLYHLQEEQNILDMQTILLTKQKFLVKKDVEK